MSTKTIKGICPIIPTTFDDKGEVDLAALDGIVRRLSQIGCHGQTLFGIAGEYYKLNDDERREMAAVVIRACRETGCASILSVTDHATELAIKRAREYENAGADCLMLLPPFFLKPGAGALREHIIAVGKTVKIPVMLQYAPEQTGVAMAPELLAGLQNEMECELIYKVENKPSGGTISRILEISGGKARIFVGNAGFQFIEGLDRGAVGAMPGCSMSDFYLRVLSAWETGDRTEAFRVHQLLLGMLNHIRQDVEQIIHFEKKICQRRGWIPSAYCRKPTFKTDAVFDALFEEWWTILEPELVK